MPNAPHAQVRDTQEGRRLASIASGAAWRRWGPYLSERQWGTVREDYSADGSAWEYFPHDHARSRAYRWGEDGIGGFADDQLRICMSVALWNGCDPILKERLFGLTNAEGNHGEDVKELTYYLDGLPTHAYMKMLYKYPQAPFPYADLVATNAARGLRDREYELIDTGVFDDNKYFDVEIEYAKVAPDDILLRITAHNRGAAASRLHVLPQICARNIWSWTAVLAKPRLEAKGDDNILIDHPDQPPMAMACEGAAALLFCDNDTNTNRLYGTDVQGWFKDGFNDALVDGKTSAVNPDRCGTKAAAHYALDIPAGGSVSVRVRLRPQDASAPPFLDFDSTFAARRAEADEFYAALQSGIADEDQRLVQRQALAGMLWSKQFYGYDVRRWLQGDPLQPAPAPERASGRNANWSHLVLGDIMSMPDTWEYPWFAAWDLAFHCVTFALIDPAFAKAQLVLVTQARSQNPNGQLPAYEWNFSDVNPPIQAWAALQIYEIDRKRSGVGDTLFLERVFHKLMLNFTWWVNREDSEGRNIFQGGFLGLDNIAPFDRSAPLPDGGHIDQSDATAWVAAFALDMMRIALELSIENHVYEDLATKYFEHFLYIAEAVHAKGGATQTGLWDEQDSFYYDVLQTPGHASEQLRVRSLVGLIPLLAVEVLHQDFARTLPHFAARLNWFMAQRPDLARLVSNWREPNELDYQLLSLMRRHRLNCVLSRMLDETEFLSDFGIRSLSKYHEQHPCVFVLGDRSFTVAYTPGEGDTRLFGGNSNWRGPIWMPINYLIVEALHKLHKFYGDAYRIECPTGSGVFLSLEGVAEELTRRLQRLFLKDPSGRRVYLGESSREWEDVNFRDRLQFHEYFHGDTGRGLGASHQTGWTGLIALLLHPRDETDSAHVTPADTTNAGAKG
ncbi:glucosidase [Methylocapsa sp. S129]|uniref:MGH1-like glycoside hydrolase domain-containing protein n=1 Tax=Methylocapsa sp. S129 TaxID=1641869 RepID=UPI00131C26A5|nr:glucosidase [Methylocapsa sp. S129]